MRPSGITARCTWPIDAAATGTGSQSRKSSSTSAPSSERTTCSARLGAIGATSCVEAGQRRLGLGWEAVGGEAEHLPELHDRALHLPELLGHVGGAAHREPFLELTTTFLVRTDPPQLDHTELADPARREAGDAGLARPPFTALAPRRCRPCSWSRATRRPRRPGSLTPRGASDQHDGEPERDGPTTQPPPLGGGERGQHAVERRTERAGLFRRVRGQVTQRRAAQERRRREQEGVVVAAGVDHDPGVTGGAAQLGGGVPAPVGGPVVVVAPEPLVGRNGQDHRRTGPAHADVLLEGHDVVVDVLDHVHAHERAERGVGEGQVLGQGPHDPGPGTAPDGVVERGRRQVGAHRDPGAGGLEHVERLRRAAPDVERDRVRADASGEELGQEAAATLVPPVGLHRRRHDVEVGVVGLGLDAVGRTGVRRR